jgi:hypothetical protein
MPPKNPVTLQINVAPVDLPYASHTLPHQMRAWAGQVEEILFTFDLHRTARGGHFGEGWHERRTPMRELLEQLCREHPGARIAEVDYTPSHMQRLADDFTAGSPIPAKDTKGAPFYPYLYGLHKARNDLVFHLDSDLMFGGASQSWIAEARTLLAENADVLACNPLPGPPTADGSLHREPAPRFEFSSPAYVFKTLTTRLFLIDRERLRERVLPLPLLGPIRPISGAKARLHGNPPYRAAELSISEAMSSAGLCRVDLLGVAPGMWSLHPPYRSEEFFRALPDLIERIENDDIPEGQRGDYELNDSMFDWSHARRRSKLRRLWA